MHRIFLEIGGYPIAWFGVMMVVAFFSGLISWNLLGRREGRDINFCSDLLLWVMVGGIVGGRLAYVASDFRYFMAQPVRILLLNQGGLIYYGGFIGAGVGILLFARQKRERLLPLLDFVITSVPLGHIFGRIGCFLNGCCYGARYDGLFSVRYPADSEYAPTGFSVHPVQLYEAAANLVVYGLLLWMYRHRRRDGQVLALYLTTYPVIRFLLEFLRGDERERWGLTVAQDVSVALFVVGVGLWIWSSRGKRTDPALKT